MKWVDEVLQEWAAAVRSGPTETVIVTPGGRPTVLLEGGDRRWDSPPTANGRQSHRIDTGMPPQGYCVRGLTGRPALANKIMRALYDHDKRCAMTLRVDYGLTEIDKDAPVVEKAKLLGQYIDAAPWPASAFYERKRRGMDTFAVSFMSSSRVRYH